jgi:triacylglycerol lipase
MKVKIIISFFVLSLINFDAFSSECVVLLHGYANSNKAMKKIEKELLEDGYIVQNISYPSTKYSIENLDKHHLSTQIDNSRCTKIHFIGHSMGGLLIRQHLSRVNYNNLGYVMFITSPNNGSEIVSFLSSHKALKWMMKGPAVKQLASESEFLQNLPKPHYPFGIITADKDANPFLSLFLMNSKNDGLVTIKSMVISGADEVLNFNTTHNKILKENRVVVQIKHFLKTGKFLKTK